jgi:hypothetical protein
MAFNITNLVNAINAKSATVGADSALDKAVLLASNVKNALIYSSLVDLPTADSSNQGDLVRIGASFGADTNYYVSHRDRWNLIGLDDSDVVTEGQVPGFQGSNYGYTSGGKTGGPSHARTDLIDKFPFASDANATDVSNLTGTRWDGAGQSSATHGYVSAGQPNDFERVIDKFQFATDGNATTHGHFSLGALYSNPNYSAAGQSSIENGFGYISGGGGWDGKNRIDRFPFASDFGDGLATDVGDLTVSRREPRGQSSTTHGYTSGGRTLPQYYNVIDKFPFTSGGNASDVGDLTGARTWGAGQSSTTHGYSAGDYFVPGPGAPSNVIDKFPFSSDADATDVGDLSVARGIASGQSSTVSGYTSGGYDTGPSNVIDKFPFSSDANATDVSDLTVSRYGSAGQQY